MADLPALREQLLSWYRVHRRDLPWRTGPGEEPDPYRIWISEVMLQQTRVEVVRPYFERWLARFPTLEHLSEATEDEVLKCWEGLGYYSRARNLRNAARQVVREHGGRIPSEIETFRSLPGVGRYTAGAVMSIAFGQETPVVDGNVRRVLARLHDEAIPAEALLWRRAEQLVAGPEPGELNQAIMELGATLCTPRAPRCHECPIVEACRAHREGRPEERPLPRGARPLPREVHGVALIRRADRLLLVRRPAGGRLGGMWEFPGIAVAPGESVTAAARRAAAECAGVVIDSLHELGMVTHRFSHREVEYRPFIAGVHRSADDRGSFPHARWVDRAGIAELALPRAQHRILALLEE